MYSLVILAAMAGGGGAAGQGYFHADPSCWGLWPVFPLGGEVIFFWAGPAALSEFEEKEWQEYLDALDEPDRSDAVYFWSRADRQGKQLLLTQVRTLRAKKDEFDRLKREAEAKAKEEELRKKFEEMKERELEEKKEKDRKDKEKKIEDKKDKGM